MSETNIVSPLRQHMIEDMVARKLNPYTRRSHIQSCKRFAAWLKRSPDTATPDEVRRFQLHLIESGTSICIRMELNSLSTDVLHRSANSRKFSPPRRADGARHHLRSTSRQERTGMRRGWD